MLARNRRVGRPDVLAAGADAPRGPRQHHDVRAYGGVRPSPAGSSSERVRHVSADALLRGRRPIAAWERRRGPQGEPAEDRFASLPSPPTSCGGRGLTGCSSSASHTLQMMRYSIFFEKLRPFWMPGRLGPLGDLMLWMVIAWLYCVGVLFPRDPHGEADRCSVRHCGLPEEGLLLALAALVFGQIILTWASGVDPVFFEVVSQSTGMICAFVGYALVSGELSPTRSGRP